MLLIEVVKKIIWYNLRITIKEVMLAFGSCQAIFTEEKRAADKVVLRLINFELKQLYMDIAQKMLIKLKDDSDLLKNVITGDESWVYGYYIKSKAQSSQWKRPAELKSKKARKVRSNVQVLLSVFFDCKDFLHH